MSSYDQLVSEHRVDPEQVLLNLGFLKRANSDTHRIPDHFLLYQSKANGITCDEYLDEYPKLKQRLDQKIAVENAFRAVNRTPPSPSPVPGQADDKSEGQSAGFVGHLKDEFPNFVGRSSSYGRQSKTKTQNFDMNDATENFGGHFEGDCAGFEGHFLGHSLGCQGRLKGIPVNFALTTVSSLFADDRLPLRYLESVMRRLRSGRDPDQAALAFDGYGLGWSWRLDSDSLSSVWLASTDLDSLSLVESVAADDWSMQPPTAGDWSTLPPTLHNWSVQPPASDEDRISHSDFPRNCSVLSALQRPLSGLLITTNGCFLEFPDHSHNPDEGQNSEDFQIDGGIFCECCGRNSDRGSSPAASAGKSWDRLDTVDFYIDDGTEIIAGYRPPAVDKPSHSRKSSRSDDMDDGESNVAELDGEDSLDGCADLAETLV